MHQPLGGAVLVMQAQAAAPRTFGGQGYGGDPAGGSWDPLKSHIHVTEPQRNSATLGSSRPRNTPEERWRIAFKKFDQDDNGGVEYEELALVLRELGHKVSKDQARRVFDHFDTDGDGRIDYDEFVAAMSAFEGLNPPPTSSPASPSSRSSPSSSSSSSSSFSPSLPAAGSPVAGALPHHPAHSPLTHPHGGKPLSRSRRKQLKKKEWRRNREQGWAGSPSSYKELSYSRYSNLHNLNRQVVPSLSHDDASKKAGTALFDFDHKGSPNYKGRHWDRYEHASYRHINYTSHFDAHTHTRIDFTVP